MTNYLSKRGNRYYFRRKIPLELRAHFGRKEIVKALGTSDPHLAAVRCREHAVVYDAIFAAARQSAESSKAAASVRASLGAAQEAAIAQQRDDWERAQLENDEEANALSYQTEEQEFAEHDRQEQRFEELVWEEQQRLRARVEAQRRLGGIDANLPTPLAAAAPTQPKDVQLSPAIDRSELHLSELVERWANERNPGPRSVAAANRVVRRFWEHCGRIPVKKITRADVIKYKDALLASGQTSVNTNKMLVALSALLNFAFNNSLADINAAQGVRIVVKARPKDARQPFDTAALNAIFSSGVYVRGERPEGGAGEASYWLPLLALFTGARIEELAQLRPEDVYQEAYRSQDGVEHRAWVLRITDEGEGQGLKNGGSRRRIPIHSELISRGFLKLIESQKGKRRIFAHLKVGPHGEESANFGRWFSKYLRRTCGITDRRMVFHSFRHGFKDICRACDVPEEVSDALTGHSGPSVSRRYGASSYPLAPLVSGVAKIQVHGVALPARPDFLAIGSCGEA
jgi:integrase